MGCYCYITCVKNKLSLPYTVAHFAQDSDSACFLLFSFSNAFVCSCVIDCVCIDVYSETPGAW